MADVLGLEEARYAVEVAAAGGHHLLLSGPKGCGKTTLAERIPGDPARPDDPGVDRGHRPPLAGGRARGGRRPDPPAAVLRAPPRRQQGQHPRRRHRPRPTRRGQPRPLRGAAARRVPAAAHRRDRRPAPTARERRGDHRPRRRVGDLSRRAGWSCSRPTPAPAATTGPMPGTTAAPASRSSAGTTSDGFAGRSPTGSTSPATSSRCRPHDERDRWSRPETSAAVRERVAAARARQAARYLGRGWRLNGTVAGAGPAQRVAALAGGATGRRRRDVRRAS